MAMLEWVFLGLFVGCCALLVKDGLVRPARVFEFPFVAGIGAASFLLVQAIGVVRAQDLAPPNGVVKALFMSSLCCLAVHCGWRARPGSRRAPRTGTSARYLYGLGLIMLAVGISGMIGLGTLTGGGIISYYSVGGAYSLEARGVPVIYWFLATYLEPGVVFCLLGSMRRGSRLGLWPSLAGLAFLLADVVLLGRRFKLAFLLIALGVLTYFWRNWMPSRTAVAVAACLGTASLFLFPYYRAYSQLGGDWEALRTIEMGEIMREVFEGREGEFSSAAYLIQVTEEQGIFQYGIGFYNAFIRYFVPKVLAGEEGKARLLMEVADAGHVGPEAGAVPNRYGWFMDPYIVPTGPASVFQQFWYFGALCFYVLARWLKGHWVRAVRGDLWSQAVYTASVTHAVAALVNDVYAIYIPVFMFILPTLALRWVWSSLRGTAWKPAQASRPDGVPPARHMSRNGTVPPAGLTCR